MGDARRRRRPVRCRRATTEDRSFVAELSAAALSCYMPPGIDVSSWLEEPAVFATVAEVGGKLAGFAMDAVMVGCDRWSPGYQPRLNSPLHLEGLALAVAPEMRRSGVGAALALRSLELARGLGARIETNVWERNEPMRRMLRRLGFAEAGVEIPTHSADRTIRMVQVR